MDRNRWSTTIHEIKNCCWSMTNKIYKFLKGYSKDFQRAGKEVTAKPILRTFVLYFYGLGMVLKMSDSPVE